MARGGDDALARRPVGWGEPLLTLDPEVAGVAADALAAGGGLAISLMKE